MNTKIITLIVAVVAVTAGGILFMEYDSNAPNTASPSTISDTNTQPNGTASTTSSNDISAGSSSNGYTLEEVAQHNSQTSCFAAINGNVYDLTSWITQHPGGPDKILSICGTDGSAAFNAQHGGERRPANELAGFYIGELR